MDRRKKLKCTLASAHVQGQLDNDAHKDSYNQTTAHKIHILPPTRTHARTTCLSPSVAPPSLDLMPLFIDLHLKKTHTAVFSPQVKETHLLPRLADHLLF